MFVIYVPNKLECFLVAGRELSLEGSTFQVLHLGENLSILANLRLSWKVLTGTNTNFLATLVNYCRKKLYNIGLCSDE
jgi:hypothetical protein